MSTLAGIAGVSGFRDGNSNSVLFNQPQGVFNYFSIWVVDTGNSVIRNISTNGATVSTLALKTPTTTTPEPSTGGSNSGSGGGGAPSLWFVALLGLLGVARRLTARAA